MEIVIAPNKIEKIQEQRLDINDKIITLVGENGCGKSAILERVFKDYLEQNDITLVSFTSGQNESFSKIFTQHLIRSRKFLIENNVDSDADTEEERAALEKQRKLNSFYFNTQWSPLLIFFATAIKHQGATRKFLREKSLIDELPPVVGATEDAYRPDISTRMWFQFRILSNYIKKLAAADNAESLDSSKRSIRKSIVHRQLERLANHYDPDYDFHSTFYTKGKYLRAAEAVRVLGRDVNEIFTFLGHALKNSQFILNHNVTLYFKDGLELNDLSDGEFQLLTIYAIVDLFDSPTTLFLFDEIDSHVHYKNTQKVWDFLRTIQGNLLTTTHSADSIMLNNPNSIRLVKKGNIEESSTAEHIFKRFELLTENKDFQYRYAAKLPYIALIDNLSDWYIFRELARIKVADFDETKFDAVKAIARSSSGNTRGTDFGKAKILWIKKMIASSDHISTKAAFLICDRDEFHIDNIREDLTVPIDDQEVKKLAGRKESSFLLSWRRREIENYLLCNTIIENNNLLDSIRGNLRHNDLPIAGNNCDNKSIQDLQAKEVIKPLYLKSSMENLEDDSGIDYDKLRALIAQIPPEEISEDIEKMYNFIVSKIA